jgi:IMP dehydrogenase
MEPQTGTTGLAQYAKAQFVRISSAGLRESHGHDVTITPASPNYPSRVWGVYS